MFNDYDATALHVCSMVYKGIKWGLFFLKKVTNKAQRVYMYVTDKVKMIGLPYWFNDELSSYHLLPPSS